MQLGLGSLRLSPADFWRATPKEIAGAFACQTQNLSRFNLNDLMERYPDE